MLIAPTITKVKACKVFNVFDYGAVGDGLTDDSKAISNAWHEACHKSKSSQILIPQGKYLINPIVLKGPCKGHINMTINGRFMAPTDPKYWFGIDHWISFRYINGLIIGGHGVLDGQGHLAWSSNTCMKDPKCEKLPISLRLDFVNDSRVHHIGLINSKNVHMNIFSCHNISIRDLKIRAPGSSPNTDGVHIGMSTNIIVSDSVISSGDDCVSLSRGTKNVDISNVKCGPGHGISIGSLGGCPNESEVEGLVVRNCNFIGTQNGLRIKTWAHSHSATVSNITFEHIKMTDVFNPIVIDQQYCPFGNCDQGYSSKVQIRDVRFKHISGTSRSEVAVHLRCSDTNPCKNIMLKDINLDYTDGTADSRCSNVFGVACGKQNPPSCMEQFGITCPHN
ncbi:hypothetical protein FNV43_RR03805 [Rhamnella rubrinervis]|uniref:Exopolygalacturonase n=1 Tax=Rhamnella rubrinervis TaxID=2594499 RepID=A0A8K0MPZ3_9ROSA|nr:hypothetical protein FNV43_RR03805 [Rhamnella rubrinervis]